MVEHEGRVLLCRRGIEPCRGLWTVPAGFLEMGESTAAGAARETWEEANARIEVGTPGGSGRRAPVCTCMILFQMASCTSLLLCDASVANKCDVARWIGRKTVHADSRFASKNGSGAWWEGCCLPQRQLCVCSGTQIMAPYAHWDIPVIGQAYCLFRARLAAPFQYSAGEESLEAKLFAPQDIPFDQVQL